MLPSTWHVRHFWRLYFSRSQTEFLEACNLCIHKAIYGFLFFFFFWCLDEVGEVCEFNLFFSTLLDPGCSSSCQAAGGSVKWGISVQVVTFCPLRLMGLLQSCLDKDRESKGGLLHCTTQQCIKRRAEKGAGGFAAFTHCFTSKLCLDKPHSTCVITTDTVAFYRQKFQLLFGH